MERIYEVHFGDGIKWHDIHTNNLRGFGVGITDERDYEVSCLDDFRWYDMHVTFYDHQFIIQVILKLLPQHFERLQCLYYWKVFMKYTIQMISGSMIHLLSFIKIGSGVQKLLVGRVINTCTHTHTE
jgi:hypothetical protein